MAKFIYFTPEEKARAQNTDLVSLLRAQGGGSTVPSVRVAMPSALSNAKYGCGFRNRLDDGWHRLHGSLTPLRLSQIVLIALRRFTARQDRFTLGLWLDECIFNPDVQIIATGPPRPAVRQWTAPPFPPFSAGSWPVPFARLFPFGLHIKRIRLTYSVLGCRQLA